MQQAMPQHRPSTVPQQQAFRAPDAGLEPIGAANTGVQTAVALVLMTSTATMIARIGRLARFMALVSYVGKLPKVQSILQRLTLPSNKGLPCHERVWKAFGDMNICNSRAVTGNSASEMLPRLPIDPPSTAVHR
jgi:hypothetical protein